MKGRCMGDDESGQKEEGFDIIPLYPCKCGRYPQYRELGLVMSIECVPCRKVLSMAFRHGPASELAQTWNKIYGVALQKEED